MKKIHAREKEQFKKLLSQGGVDDIDKRFQVLETFLTTEKHVTIDELVLLLKENGSLFEPDFVRDTLKLMVRYGFAEKNQFDDRKTRYEHRHIGLHHDHMICTKCQKIIEFNDDDIEQLQVRISNKYGFHMLLHKMEIYGICSECLGEQNRLLSLDMAKPGHRLIVKEFAGGTTASMHLISMGIRVGDQIEVITNSGKGQVVISLGYSRYVLGRGLARKIIVEQIPAD